MIKALTQQSCDVRSFTFSNLQVHEVSADTVILTYQAKQDATCDGHKLPETVFVSSVYVNKGGKWLSASYHETPVAKMQ